MVRTRENNGKACPCGRSLLFQFGATAWNGEQKTYPWEKPKAREPEDWTVAAILNVIKEKEKEIALGILKNPLTLMEKFKHTVEYISFIGFGCTSACLCGASKDCKCVHVYIQATSHHFLGEKGVNAGPRAFGKRAPEKETVLVSWGRWKHDEHRDLRSGWETFRLQHNAATG